MYHIYIIRRGPKKLAQPKARINEAIRVSEVRLIDAEGKNLGVMSIGEALKKASLSNLDLVEVTPNSKPPIAHITDFGKYQYEQNKLKKQWAQKDKEMGKKKQEDIKQVQIKPGTSGGILQHRATKIREWLNNGSRVQIDLFLFGRYKSMDEKFLKDRLDKFLHIISGDIYMTDDIKKSPKGFSVVLQPDKGKKLEKRIQKDIDPETKEKN